MKSVLFVCTQNAGRSRMAQGLSERLTPAALRAGRCDAVAVA